MDHLPMLSGAEPAGHTSSGALLLPVPPYRLSLPRRSGWPLR